MASDGIMPPFDRASTAAADARFAAASPAVRFAHLLFTANPWRKEVRSGGKDFDA
jgi:hypothetical protein